MASDPGWAWCSYGKGTQQLSGEQARRKATDMREAYAKDGTPHQTQRAKKAAEAADLE